MMECRTVLSEQKVSSTAIMIDGLASANPLTDEVTSFGIKHCIVLAAGPSNHFINKEFVQKVVDALKTQGGKVTQIGDGEAYLTSSQVFQFYHHLLNANEHCMIFIIAHSEVLDNKYQLHLENKPTSIRDFFKKLAMAMVPLDIFSIGCMGAAANEAFEESGLAENSTYVSLSSFSEFTEKTCPNALIDALLHDIILAEISAENLLLVYLTKLKQKITPDILSCEDSMSLKDKLLAHLGVKFSADEKEKIIYFLNPYVARSKLEFLMNKISESSTDENIDEEEYGLALAICHAAQKGIIFDDAFDEVEEDSIHSTSISISSNLSDNPVFDQGFLATSSENGLSYALNVNLPCPTIYVNEIENHPYPLLYVTEKICNYFSDPELVMIAPYLPNHLPDQKKGYYLVALAISYDGLNLEKGRFYAAGVHFLVQNKDGFFSRRDEVTPESADASGIKITLPETAVLARKSDTMHYSSNFEGYLYFKTGNKRLEGSNISTEWRSPKLSSFHG